MLFGVQSSIPFALQGSQQGHPRLRRRPHRLQRWRQGHRRHLGKQGGALLIITIRADS